jgi:hypothetical protein
VSIGGRRMAAPLENNKVRTVRTVRRVPTVHLEEI